MKKLFLAAIFAVMTSVSYAGTLKITNTTGGNVNLRIYYYTGTCGTEVLLGNYSVASGVTNINFGAGNIAFVVRMFSPSWTSLVASETATSVLPPCLDIDDAGGHITWAGTAAVADVFITP